MGLINETQQSYYLGADGNWNSNDEDYGNYQFISVKDIVNNFMVAYVGEGKIISKIKRTDAAFHAKRALQELSFDTLPSEKAIEIELGAALEMILPQDYVNYVKFTWTGGDGIEHVIYPTRNTSNPTAYVTDSDDEYTFDGSGNVIVASKSETLKNFEGANQAETNKSELSTSELYNLYRHGRRYGLSPEDAQGNGVFYIDKQKGIAHFSSNLVNKIITLKYISDSLGTDEEMRVHKFAEEAMYKYMAHAVLATRANTQEYIVQRFKKEAFAAKRVAKLRMSNLKISELAQVMRNQSKWIKH
jgi:hypothetical protein